MKLGSDALYTDALSIGSGSMLDVNGLGLFVAGDAAAAMNGWIAAGMLRDSTLVAPLKLAAEFDAGTGVTLLTTFVPEPAAATLLALAVAALLSVRRRRA